MCLASQVGASRVFRFFPTLCADAEVLCRKGRDDDIKGLANMPPSDMVVVHL